MQYCLFLLKIKEAFIMKRRHFIKTTAVLSLAAAAFPGFAEILKQGKGNAFLTVRRITNGPKFHWFGYYDKLQIDPTNRYALGLQTDFEGRTPTPADTITIGMIDLQNNDTWIKLGESKAWCWQQGCMLQWLPGSKDDVIWNDREGGQFVSHILNVHTGKKRTLPKPVYTLSPDAKWALGLDFGRLQDLRPGYGYQGVPDKYKDLKAPDKTGIYHLDITTGKDKLLIPYSECSAMPHLGEDISNYWHWYNHLLINPGGERFLFLSRWRKERIFTDQGTGFITRMFTSNKNGEDLYVLDPSGNTSHFVWRDNEHVCAWTKPIGAADGFYLLKDKTQDIQKVGEGVMIVNGHNTYLPNKNNEWILNDCYPQGKERLQTPYLYNVPANKRYDLGNFYEPDTYKGEFRCDLHPRYSPNGKMVIIDSTHEGMGRQMYLIGISELVN